jgi:hypothetical protein
MTDRHQNEIDRTRTRSVTTGYDHRRTRGWLWYITIKRERPTPPKPATYRRVNQGLVSTLAGAADAWGHAGHGASVLHILGSMVMTGFLVGLVWRWLAVREPYTEEER